MLAMLTTRKFLLLLFLFTGSRAYNQLTQLSEIDDLSGSLINKIRKSSSEKIFVQTDRHLYNTGEKIWFKVFCLSSLTGKPVYSSKTLFIDIVNNRDSVICQSLLHNESGSTDGYMIVPNSCTSGNYWIRSYSQRILRDNAGNIFVAPIYIHNPLRQAENKLASDIQPLSAGNITNNESRLEFFPEGGSIIAGIDCTIAFRAYDKNGNPASIFGYVTDNRDSVTTRFQTSYSGLGKFNFEVWSNRKYTVHIKDPDNKQITYPLPSLLQSVAQLAVTSQDNDVVNIRVALGDSLNNKNFSTYLLGVSKDSLCFAATGRGMYEVSIAKKDFPAGKATLLLFNDKRQIISERNIYINRDNHVTVAIKPIKSNDQSPGKLNFAVAVTDADNRPEPALLTMSVTNDSMVDQNLPELNIRDRQLDDIDFPQKTLSYQDIENYLPAQWDLIMLTQKNKYRQLWNIDSSSIVADKDDEVIHLKTISGKITNNDNDPAANISLTLFSNQKSLIVLKDTTDQKGRFEFELPYVPEDSTLFTIKMDNTKNSKLKINVDELRLPVFETPVNFKNKQLLFSDKQITDAIKSMSGSVFSTRGQELKEVRLSSKINPKNSNVITSKELQQGVNSVGNAILNVPGVQLKGGYLVIHGGTDMLRVDPSSEPLVVINGVATPGEGIVNVKYGKPVKRGIDEISESDQVATGAGSPVLQLLNSIPANTIDNVTVLSGSESAFYGSQGANGVILVTTSTNGNRFTTADTNGLQKTIYVKTYLRPVAFPETGSSKKPKSKTNSNVLEPTIYWNGSTLTGKNGQAIYNFYLDDSISTYTITVTGVTSKGNPIYTKEKISR